MSNQVFSNDTLKYSDQITVKSFAGQLMPSLSPFVGTINFRKDGNTVIIKMPIDTQVVCTALDYAIKDKGVVNHNSLNMDDAKSS